MKPVIFVDIDSTVADVVPHWLDLYNKEHGTNFIKTDIKEYDFAKTLPHPMNSYYRSYFGVLPVEGAIESLIKLQSTYRIVYATAGFGREWLSWHISFEDEDFIHVKDKGLLYGLGLIDDSPDNLEAFQGQLKYLLTQPWNTGKGMNDVNWNVITHHLLKIARSL